MGLSNPSGFSIKYNEKYTGLDTLINLQGYYTSIGSGREDYDSFLFYSDGQVCFSNLGNPSLSFTNNYLYLSHTWGTYKVKGDLIEIQLITQDGSGGGGYRVLNNQFIIQSDKKLTHTSPTYRDIDFTFYPIENKIDSTLNPYLNKKWFRN